MDDTGALGGGGGFLGPLTRKMTGAKHSGMLKGCDPVSFERTRTVLHHREHQGCFSQLAIGNKSLGDQDLEENSYG